MAFEDWLAENWPPYKKQLENKKLGNKVKYKLTFKEMLDIERKRVLEVRDNMTDQILQFRLDAIDKALVNSLTPKQLLQNELVRELVEALRNIKSTSKKDLTENPAYWGEMIVGEAMQALKKFEVSK